MTRDCRMVWDDCLRIIKKNVSPQSFKTWFEPIKPVRLDNEVLTIQVPNKFFFEWLEENFVQLLKKSIRQELGDRGRLVYHIPENGNGKELEVPVQPRVSAKPSSDKDNEPIPGVFDAEMIKNPFIIPGIKRIKVDPQLNPEYTFDTFIEGDCN
ncbi:MAG: chromosomal replication initiator protein DnaA, partial [Saprospiraceae bacterium]|nr:chromosomal replication initiator protein DnaA [Saprospiraceae bacterium]